MGIATTRVDGYDQDVLLVKNIDGAPTPGGGTVQTGGVVNTGTPTNQTTGTLSPFWLNARGALEVAGFATNGADATGNALALLTTQTGTALIGGAAAFVFNGTTWDRQRGDTVGTFVVQKPSTSGGTPTLKVISAASTNATIVKASPGQLYGMQFSNSGAGWAFIKFYNKATAPVVGTDVPVEIVGIPPGGRCEVNRPLGMPAAAGISYAITGAPGDTDTTAVAAGQVVGSIQYA